jgi:hypothetical protein
MEDVKAKLDTMSTEWWQKVEDNLLNERTKEAIKFITGILENLKAFDMPDVEYKIPRFILLALLKRAQEAESSNKSAIDKSGKNDAMISAEIDPESFQDDKKMGQFALDVYAASWMSDPNDAAKKMGLENGGQDVIFTWFTDDGDHCPKFMIFVDDATKSVVLAIRGTYSLADVIVDVVCDEDKFLDGFAHRGIHWGAKKIIKEGGQALAKALQDRPDYRLVITGHSLGAGTAVLITMDIITGHLSEIVPKKTSVHCVALAPPPVYRISDTKKILPHEFREKIKIYINGNDVVPRLSLANMAKLMAMLRSIDQVPMTVQDHLKILAGLEEPEVLENLSKIQAALDNVVQDQFPALDHPGTIFYLKRDLEQQADPGSEGKPIFRICQTPSKFFSESLLLFENMVLDHLQPYYEEAFANVRMVKKDITDDKDT